MKLKHTFFETLGTFDLEKLKNKDFYGETSMFITELFLKLEEKSKVYFQVKQKTINKHVKMDDAGKPVIKDGRWVFKDEAKFYAEMDEILNMEIEFDFEKFEFDFSKQPDMSPAENIILMKFIKR